MGDITRYNFNIDSLSDCYCEGTESEHGSYVLYEDHLEKIERLEADKAELLNSITDLVALHNGTLIPGLPVYSEAVALIAKHTRGSDND